MHNSYYFLRKLAPEVSRRIKGYAIVACFSQTRDELVIELNNGGESFFIQTSFSAELTAVNFPSSFHRARKNSVDLFPEVVMTRVVGVRHFQHERCFAIDLENDRTLLFKMQGRSGNVVLFQAGRAMALFQNQRTTDWETDLTALDRTIDFSHEAFLQHVDNLSSLYFTWGRPVWEYLAEQGFAAMNLDDKWKLIQATINQLESPKFYVVRQAASLEFSLLPRQHSESLSENPVEAVTQFVTQWNQEISFLRDKKKTIDQVREQFRQTENYIIKTRALLEQRKTDQHYQQWADLLMANLHHATPGSERVMLRDFYTDAPVEIKLKRELSWQKNAEVFYRKSKNQQIELQHLEQNLVAKQQRLDALQEELNNLMAATDWKELRSEQAHRRQADDTAEVQSHLPYREVVFKTFRIWIGKNAAANDEMLRRYSFKDDLWLHAKDVSGSHVLIKFQAGKPFPRDVIEYAASLAAGQSKRKHETLCPVTVTPRKFVRKRKGDPDGAVIVEREEVILVEPLAR